MKNMLFISPLFLLSTLYSYIYIKDSEITATSFQTEKVTDDIIAVVNIRGDNLDEILNNELGKYKKNNLTPNTLYIIAVSYTHLTLPTKG